jgi:type IX secretion system PorP/SprF family membrane protein
MNQSIKLITCAGLLFLGTLSQSMAQLRPFSAMYYQNRYLANPAMAGTDKGIVVNLGYLRQWMTVPGSPKAQYATGTYRFNDKVGLGLGVFNEEAGLITQTKIAATYAYHLVLNEAKEQKLHFGLSAGFKKQRLDMDALRGDIDDPVVNNFNDRPLYFDGDFGVAFTTKRLTFQASLPNMRTVFESNEGEANTATFFTSVSYIFTIGAMNTFGLEPMIGYRGVKEHGGLVDVGVNATFLDNSLNFFVLYHSSKNASLGAGVRITPRFRFTGMYLTGSPGLGTYAKDNFELGLQVLLDQE